MQKKYCSLALYVLGQINFSSFSLLGLLQRGADYSEPDGRSAMWGADEGRGEDRSRSWVLVASGGGGETQRGGGSQWCSRSGVMAVITGHVRSRLLVAGG